MIIMMGLASYAQSPVLNIHTAKFAEIENAYYKDIDNIFNQFEGNWVFRDANKTIRFRFIKKTMFYRMSVINCYADYLVGEVQYIENGIEKLNSLNNLNVNHTDIHKYNITGFMKVDYDYYPGCTECSHDVARVLMRYDEATNDDAMFARDLLIARVTENGVAKLKIQFGVNGGPSGMSKSSYYVDSTTRDFTVPFGNYTLVKED